MKHLLAEVEASEVLAGVGLAMMGAGLALVSVAAALVVVGGLLFALAVWPYLGASRKGY